jgi:hypothetical protein
MLEDHGLAIVGRGSFDKSLGQRTQSPGGVVAHREAAVYFIAELKCGNVCTRIDLSHLWMNDSVHTQEERTGGRLSAEESRVTIKE